MPNNNQLKAMINKHGHGILNDTYRCKALTLDYFSVENTRQKELLKLSIDQKIPSRLIAFIKNGTYTLEIKQVIKKLKETNKINQEDAEWIIKIWENALLKKKQPLKSENRITNKDAFLINYEPSGLAKTLPKPKNNLIISPSSKNLLWGLIGSLIFVAIGLVMIFESDPLWLKKIIINGIGYLGLLFFGFCSIVFLVKLIFPMPIFIVDEKGVKTQSLGGELKLKWEEILDIKIEEYMGNRMLAIYPLKLNILLKQSSWWYRAGLKLNSHTIGKPIAIRIAENLFVTSLEKIIEQISALDPKNKGAT